MADRVVTVAASGGDYTTFALAISGETDFQAGEDNIIFRRIDNVRESRTSTLNITGFTTSASHRVILECSRSAQHDGTRNSGAGIVASVSWSSAIESRINYVTIKNLEIANSSSTSSIVGYSNYGNTIYDSCLIRGAVNSLVFNAENNIVCNCIIYGGTGYGILFNEDKSYVYYNTILNCGTYGIRNDTYGTIYSKNNYIGLCGTADYSAVGSFNLTTSSSEDGSCSTTAISIDNCGFTSSTSGSENAKIGSSSSLRSAGTNLSSDSVYPVSVDCFGNSRASTPCIGAVEYVSSVNYIPAIINNYRQQGVM